MANITFEAAKEKAKKLNSDVNFCEEWTNAWIFSDRNNMSFGGSGPVVVLKYSGRAINMTDFIDNAEGDRVREFNL